MMGRSTYIDDLRQVMPKRLLTPEETLNTSDINQKKFTDAASDEPVFCNEYWRVVAVTLEKNVAMVVMFIYRVVALSFSSVSMNGNAMRRENK